MLIASYLILVTTLTFCLGAGQAMEDGWVLGRALSEHLSGVKKSHFQTLESTARLYQTVRLPRAQNTQATSRAAGNTYEMQTEEMLERTFEECIPIIAELTRERMKFVWEEDLDAAYEKIRDELDGRGLTGDGSSPIAAKKAVVPEISAVSIEAQ